MCDMDNLGESDVFGAWNGGDVEARRKALKENSQTGGRDCVVFRRFLFYFLFWFLVFIFCFFLFLGFLFFY